MGLREAVISVLQEKGYHPITQGSYIQTIGPRFETRAEIRLYKDYFDVVGMTGAAEATLAQELGLGLCMVGIVDNMGHGLGDPLSVESFQALQAKNHTLFEQVIHSIVAGIDSKI